MAKVPGIVKQLRKERDRVEKQLSGLNAALSAFIGAYTGKAGNAIAKPTRKRRKMSAKARAKIAAAQKKRWKVWKAKQKKSA
jgi:hypothetical protein